MCLCLCECVRFFSFSFFLLFCDSTATKRAQNEIALKCITCTFPGCSKQIHDTQLCRVDNAVSIMCPGWKANMPFPPDVGYGYSFKDTPVHTHTQTGKSKRGYIHSRTFTILGAGNGKLFRSTRRWGPRCLKVCARRNKYLFSLIIEAAHAVNDDNEEKWVQAGLPGDTIRSLLVLVCSGWLRTFYCRFRFSGLINYAFDAVRRWLHGRLSYQLIWVNWIKQDEQKK